MNETADYPKILVVEEVPYQNEYRRHFFRVYERAELIEAPISQENVYLFVDGEIIKNEEGTSELISKVRVFFPKGISQMSRQFTSHMVSEMIRLSGGSEKVSYDESTGEASEFWKDIEEHSNYKSDIDFIWSQELKKSSGMYAVKSEGDAVDFIYQINTWNWKKIPFSERQNMQVNDNDTLIYELEEEGEPVLSKAW